VAFSLSCLAGGVGRGVSVVGQASDMSLVTGWSGAPGLRESFSSGIAFRYILRKAEGGLGGIDRLKVTFCLSHRTWN
jgi:hypothetical protein